MLLDYTRPPKNRIEELRNYQLFSQQALAGLINEICGTKYNQKSVSRWENGESFLPQRVLVALALVFDCSIEYLLFLSDAEKVPLYPEYEAMKKKINRDV